MCYRQRVIANRLARQQALCNRRKKQGGTCSSVTRYFSRQLLNKHAKNYQNVEKITKCLLSAKVGLKINKTSQ
jgi:hypothetical protein